MTVFFSLKPMFFAKAKTAAICVPPANITFADSEAVLSIPATDGIMGSPSSATTSYGSAVDWSLFSALCTVLFFKLVGFWGILLLTNASTPSPFNTPSAVVVPPGMLSPIIRQSADEPRDLPTIRPFSTAFFTNFLSSADSCAILLPGSKPSSTYGSLGITLLPAFITKHGILAVSNATLVRRAGVGLPSGVIGMASMLLQ